MSSETGLYSVGKFTNFWFHYVEWSTQIHLHNNHNHHAHHKHKKQWRIQEFTNGGGGDLAAVFIIFEVLKLFWCPLQYPSESIRIICIFLTLHVDYNKVNVCYAVKIYKNKPNKNFQRRGGGTRCDGDGSAFEKGNNKATKYDQH